MKNPVIFGIFWLIFSTNLVPAQPVTLTSSNLPIVIIDTEGQQIPDDYKINAHMGIIYNGVGERNNIGDAFNNYDGRIGIEIRGSSSQMFPKKQYALETRDSVGVNLNVPLIGMPAENDWVLYAPYSDKTLIRNVLAYQLANDLGWYASRTRFCELILNGDYRGVYVLMEKIKRDNDRVDISTLNPDEIAGDDLTGGYIVKVDKIAGENIDGWTSPFPPIPGSNYRIFYQYHYPKPDEIVAEQQAYIKDLVTEFEAAMQGIDYADPVTGYRKYILPESFIDIIILTELGKNVDGYRLSAFMYKDRESIDNRFIAGPVWDFNLAFGNANYYGGGATTGWQVEINSRSDFRNDSFKVPFWWEKLFNEAGFASQLNCRWVSLRQNLLSSERLLRWVDSIAVVLDESQNRNFLRWPILDQYIWPNQVWLGTYAHEINYLKNWLTSRLAWLDNNMPGNCASSITRENLEVPQHTPLEQNYPNPFNGITVIPYALPPESHGQIVIFNINGKTVRNFDLSDRRGMLIWDGKDANGKDISSGIYFYRLTADRIVLTRQMVLLR